jgi:lipopolysaccharide export LptBFGC system permease protein LptF
MSQTFCERVASPLLELHRKTTSPAAVGVLALFALSVVGYGLSAGNHHVIWFGVLLALTSWYGFLLSGCERLLAAKDREISALQKAKANTA